MTLRNVAQIAIPDSNATLFDHGAFEPRSRRIFVAHTARSRLEVIDHDSLRHIASLDGFPGAAGVVADDGTVLVTNRGSAQLAVVDATTLRTRLVLPTAARPNGVACHAGRQLAVVACIGDESHGPELLTFSLNDTDRWSLSLPGRPRWCVMDAAGDQIFLAIREPAMVLTALLPDLRDVRHWTIPVEGPHGLDIDHATGMLYVACDGGALVQCDAHD